MGNVEFTPADKCVVFPISQFHYSSVAHSADFSSEGSKNSERLFIPSSGNFCEYTLKPYVCNEDQADKRVTTPPTCFSCTKHPQGCFLSIRHKWIIPLGQDERQSGRTTMSTFVCVANAGEAKAWGEKNERLREDPLHLMQISESVEANACSSIAF